MKLSNSGMGTIRVNNLDQMYPAQDMLMQSGQIVQYGAGIFGYGTTVLKVIQRVCNVVRNSLNEAGLVEVELPTLQPEEIWKKSGRLEKYIEEDVMFRVLTDKGNYCMAPTAEEAIVEFSREKLKSFKHLPVIYYQIGNKYRKEIRNRGYILRGKNFLMMDAYSFDSNINGLEKSYKIVRKAYLKIGEKLGLNIIPVVADNGSMGGKKSEEFMIISSIGEDTILYDENTGTALNTEVLEREDYKEYLKNEYGIEDIANLQEKKSVELGHIFQLGTFYEKMGSRYIDRDGKERPFYMGCYGIGITRLVATIYENSVLKNEKGEVVGISLPKEVAPFYIQIIPNLKNDSKVKLANELYEKMNGMAILDDRNDVSFGSKIKDAKILGTPYIAIIGDKVEEGKIELEETKTGNKEIVSIDELLKKF